VFVFAKIPVCFYHKVVICHRKCTSVHVYINNYRKSECLVTAGVHVLSSPRNRPCLVVTNSKHVSIVTTIVHDTYMYNAVSFNMHVVLLYCTLWVFVGVHVFLMQVNTRIILSINCLKSMVQRITRVNFFYQFMGLF
jgi:hypothetical protein